MNMAPTMTGLIQELKGQTAEVGRWSDPHRINPYEWRKGAR